MKKIMSLFLTIAVVVSCNNGGTETTGTSKDSTMTTSAPSAMNYPYTIDHPDYWDIGSSANTMVALSALKAFENGNIPESIKYFGDSVHIQFDGMDKTVPADTLQAMFTNWRNGYKSMNIKMNDWESVISKDKKEEWVTLWYRQKWEDAKGHSDSLDIIDDLRLKDGKIVRLDEYSRKLH